MTTIRFCSMLALALVAMLCVPLVSAQLKDYLRADLDRADYLLEDSNVVQELTLGSYYEQRPDGACDEVRTALVDPVAFDRTKPETTAPAIKTEQLIVSCRPIPEQYQSRLPPIKASPFYPQ